MDNIYTKSQLMIMNTSNPLWIGAILNIEKLNDTQLARIYPTYNAGMRCGRLYVALPSDLVITHEIKEKYNIWM